MPNRSRLTTALITYAAVALIVFAFAVLRANNINRYRTVSAPDSLSENPRYYEPPDPNAKPFFSINTNRTYATTDRARVWVNYRGLDALDFRLYKVKDPVKFFTLLRNPHQVGEDEEGAIAKSVERKPTFLERLREFKNSIYIPVRNYARAQLQNSARKQFNQRFRQDAEEDVTTRTPLNVADYARVPLLNPDQMVSSWREKLTPLEDEYDRRMISLGKREAGVYLVEVVHDDLRAYGVAIVTDMTMVQKTSNDGQILTYAVDRRTGAPRAGAQIQIIRDKQATTSGTTNADGIYRTRLARKKTDTDEDGESEEDAEDDPEAETPGIEPASDAYLLTATHEDDFAISDLDSFYFGGGDNDSGAELTSYIYTDRPVYRPAQKVFFKGILRDRTTDGYRLLPARNVSVTVTDNDGGQIYARELPLSSRGTFSGELDLAEEAPLGSYNLTATIGERTANSYFEVQEYKKPEYKVRVTTPDTYVRVGEGTRFQISARYFFGAPVARADVKYYVYRSRYYPWWRGGAEDGEEEEEFAADESEEDESGSDYGGYGDNLVQEGDGKLDADGRLEVPFTVPPPGAKDTWDYTYRLEAQVTDLSRRGMEASGQITGVRGNTVASAEPERYAYYQGDTARINVRAGTHQGQPVATNVKLTFTERRWNKVTKRTEAGDEYPDYELAERELSSATVQTNERGEAAYDYLIPINGTVHIKTTVEEAGRQITAHGGSIWIADRAGDASDYSYEGEEMIKLVPDKKSYRPGETARVLALLPHADAHLLVTTELMNVMTVRRIHSKGRAVMIDVPIEANYAPNVFLNVTYVRASELYTQDVSINVPARNKILNLEIIPNKSEYRPRDTASYTISARNADGTPAANAEISFGVVDEAVYSIAPESATDIRRDFYGRGYNQVQTNFTIHYNFTGYAGKRPVQLASNKRAYQLADFKAEGELVNPMIRRLFKDTAFWNANVTTGADGRATVNVELPDNLTTWRATARAITSDTRVGTKTQKVIARKNLILRMATPRFLTAGDTVTLSAITHNYLNSDKNARISLEVAGARLLDTAQQSANIAKQGEHRVDWRVNAPESGELRLLAKSLTDEESDAIELTIPIHPRGLKQTRGEALALADEAVERTFTYNFPANADRNARTLRIEAAPSLAGTLFGALDYLTSFPYGCTEQTMSSFLPNVVVAGTLGQVESATVRDRAALDRKVKRGLKRLYTYQHTDGGWGWWKDDDSDAFMTAYVVDGFALAQGAGYEIEADRLKRARESLTRMLASGKAGDNAELDAESRAYMIYAMNASGGANADDINKLFAARDRLQPYGRALLALMLGANNDRRGVQVAGEIERTARADDRLAHWSSRHRGHFNTEQINDVEATALSLKALARITPQSPLLPRAARWLVNQRRHGHYWTSTKETAFAILGLTDYLKGSNELSPDYALEIYVNGEQVAAQQVTTQDATSGRTFVIERRREQIGNDMQVRVVKRGSGVLYLANTLVHYTNEETTNAQSSPALRINREYLRLKVGGDADNPTWQVEPIRGELRSGELIVSRLTVEGRAARLLIEDPIPAGCEQITEAGGLDLTYKVKDFSSWYSEREFRDNRTALFVNRLDGRAVYSYAMRVQVPGDFRAAPARVEEMYQPSVNANTASAQLTILDK